jgi:hypothetical protein
MPAPNQLSGQAGLDALVKALPPQAAQQQVPAPQGVPQGQPGAQPQQPSFTEMLVRHLIQMLQLPQSQPPAPPPAQAMGGMGRFNPGNALQQRSADLDSALNELKRQNGGQ